MTESAFRHIPEIVGINTESMNAILKKHLVMRKVSARGVAQNQKNLDTSRKTLDIKKPLYQAVEVVSTFQETEDNIN